MWSKPWPSWTKLAFARRHPSPELGGGRWPSAPSWCRSCAGTWNGSPNPAREALSSSAPKGRRLRRSNFREHWHKARESVGLPDLHFRPAPYGRHAFRRHWRDPQGTDGPAWPLQRQGGHDLPARDLGPGLGHRQGARHPATRGRGRGARPGRLRTPPLTSAPAGWEA